MNISVVSGIAANLSKMNMVTLDNLTQLLDMKFLSGVLTSFNVPIIP